MTNFPLLIFFSFGYESLCRVDGSEFNIVTQTEDTVEISFVRKWDNSSSASYVSPFIIDKRFPCHVLALFVSCGYLIFLPINVHRLNQKNTLDRADIILNYYADL